MAAADRLAFSQHGLTCDDLPVTADQAALQDIMFAWSDKVVQKAQLSKVDASYDRDEMSATQPS